MERENTYLTYVLVYICIEIHVTYFIQLTNYAKCKVMKGEKKDPREEPEGLSESITKSYVNGAAPIYTPSSS